MQSEADSGPSTLWESGWGSGGSLSLPGLLITIVIIVTIIIMVIMGYNIGTNSNHKNNKNKNDLQARAFSIPLAPSSMPGRNRGVTYWAPHPGGRRKNVLLQAAATHKRTEEQQFKSLKPKSIR